MSTKIASFRVNVWVGIECLSFDWDRFPKLRQALRSLDFGIAIEWQPMGFGAGFRRVFPHMFRPKLLALSFTKIDVADLGNHAEYEKYEIFTHQLSTLPKIK